MQATNTIAIFDIGKTNKKLFLFDEDYNIVLEHSMQTKEIEDEDGDACENLQQLNEFVLGSLNKVLAQKEFIIKAVNFSTYGASFVLVNENAEAIAPLYNYLKPYPKDLLRDFYDRYGGEELFTLKTSSPVLGSLNSGLQLYRLQKQQSDLFSRSHYALHLPQYISALITKHFYSDITSIGCHTAMWDFNANKYHEWIINEGINKKLAPIVSSDKSLSIKYTDKDLLVGVGLHDSSAALIPYLINFEDPFVLISTGTWCISLNPFNKEPLTSEELRQDCLCYYTFEGKPVKASRLFAGNDHEIQLKRLASHFNKPVNYYREVVYDRSILDSIVLNSDSSNLDQFDTYEQAYHALMHDITLQQKQSTELVMLKETRRIFVDGGFGQNNLFMNMLSSVFAGVEVYAASMAQATALGAALAIHSSWNPKPLRKDLISLKYYSDHKEAFNL